MVAMSLSSPFRTSHRRTRSHSSLSTPSSSPIPRNDQWRPLQKRSHVQPQQLSSDFASYFDQTQLPPITLQPPEMWQLHNWRLGKRPRRDPSASVDDADMESNDEPMPASPDLDNEHSPSTLAFSAPPTPHLPCTSDAFHFFPERPSVGPVRPSTSTTTLHNISHVHDLSHTNTDPFTDLRNTIKEAGEGFVRRMREWEESRSRAGPSRTSLSTGISRKDAYRTRGRKRPSPISPKLHVKRKDVDVTPNEDDSDVEILSNGLCDYQNWSPSKKRAVSLDALNPSLTMRGLPFAGVRLPETRRDRSSSPSDRHGSSGSAYSSEDEDIVLAPGCHNTRQYQQRHDVSPIHSVTPPLSFTFSTNSRCSSIASISQMRCLDSSESESTSPRDIGLGSMASVKSVPSTRTERAVAALSLALANGAGSVSDYEALRTAQDALLMDNSEVGSLWD